MRRTAVWMWTQCAPCPPVSAKYQEDGKGSLLIITHSTKILESLHVDATHVMVEGSIIKNGGASLVDEINESGFAEYEQR